MTIDSWLPSLQRAGICCRTVHGTASTGGSINQSSRTRSNAGGTGLGLAICREIIAAHGGQIWAESGTGPGSRFVFVLPGDSGPAAQSARGAPDAARVLDEEPEGRG